MLPSPHWLRRQSLRSPGKRHTGVAHRRTQRRPNVNTDKHATVSSQPEKAEDTIDRSIIESKCAIGQEELNTLHERSFSDATQFHSELLDLYGMSWIDDELRTPL